MEIFIKAQAVIIIFSGLLVLHAIAGIGRHIHDPHLPQKLKNETRDIHKRGLRIAPVALIYGAFLWFISGRL